MQHRKPLFRWSGCHSRGGCRWRVLREFRSLSCGSEESNRCGCMCCRWCVLRCCPDVQCFRTDDCRMTARSCGSGENCRGCKSCCFCRTGCLGCKNRCYGCMSRCCVPCCFRLNDMSFRHGCRRNKNHHCGSCRWYVNHRRGCHRHHGSEQIQEPQSAQWLRVR